jgi:gas vesicle protein
MKKDVAQMKKVAKQAVTDKPWARLKDDIAPENLQKTKDEIAERIEKGEDQIASQPLDF